jgi:hypothetical protein
VKLAQWRVTQIREAPGGSRGTSVTRGVRPGGSGLNQRAEARQSTAALRVLRIFGFTPIGTIPARRTCGSEGGGVAV